MKNIIKSVFVGLGAALSVMLGLFLLFAFIPMLGDYFNWDLMVTMVVYLLWLLWLIFTVFYLLKENKTK